MADQSVPPCPPKGRRESYEEDGRDDGMMGMSYRISYYTMASLGSALAQLAFMAHWVFTLLHCNQERFEEVYKSSDSTTRGHHPEERRGSCVKSYKYMAGISLTRQTAVRDILIVGDWEEYQKARDYRKDIQTDRQTDRLCIRGRYVRERERESESPDGADRSLENCSL